MVIATSACLISPAMAMIAANRGNAFSKSIASIPNRFERRSKRQAVGEKPVVVMWLPNCPTGRSVARHKGLALLPLELPARTLFEHCSLLVAA